MCKGDQGHCISHCCIIRTFIYLMQAQHYQASAGRAPFYFWLALPRHAPLFSFALPHHFFFLHHCHHAICLPLGHRDEHHLLSLGQWGDGAKNVASAQHCIRDQINTHETYRMKTTLHGFCHRKGHCCFFCLSLFSNCLFRFFLIIIITYRWITIFATERRHKVPSYFLLRENT